MSLFLDRQKVRKRHSFLKRIRIVEQMLFSLLFVCGGVALLYGAYLLIVFGPVFPIKEVIVAGDNITHVTVEDVEDVAGIHAGQNLFAADVDKGHERLRAQPWIREATIRRRLPNTIWIYVSEHVPVAMLIKDGHAFYVDGDGKIFKQVDAGEPREFPVISGAENEKSLRQSLELLVLYKNSVVGQTWGIAEFAVDGSKGFSIITEKGPVEILFGKDNFEQRLKILESYHGAITRDMKNIRYVLANDEKKVIVGYNQLSVVSSQLSVKPKKGFN